MKRFRITEKQFNKIKKNKVNENERALNYMFFQNLEQLKRQAELLLDIDKNQINTILEDGHDWAEDHISSSKENLDQVFDFLMNKINKKSFDESIESFTEPFLNENSGGKNCADTDKGCIRKRKSGWVILNNKKGGVWRKCDSKKHCEEILDAFHASK
tara:strand:- start:7509 stop:7982 length:474 start_codon:yes stop_codon:yes gene_type:complete